MIYTLGDSFTKWYWPTWSDWLSKYLDQPLTNLAYSGFTNELIYYQLMNLKSQLTKTDKIYIMWTGSNRVCEWYDQEYVTQNNCAGFFPPTNGKLWFTAKTPWQGLYKTQPDCAPSLTEMIINNFDIVLKTQWLLDSVGCDYQMMFWQNPWLDTRDTFIPTYQSTWEKRQGITKSELQNAMDILDLPLVGNMLQSINWQKFACAPVDIANPRQYQGLREFAISDRELVMLNHNSDPHPNTLAHHDWTVRYLVGGANHHRELAHQLAVSTQDLSIPNYDFVECIVGSSIKLCNLL